MTPEVFQAVRRIFDEVIDLPAATRTARVQELTSDQSVIEQVLALLAANEAATDLTASTPVRAMLAGASNVKLAAGEVLGAWRVDREIGHGGMGSVYLVERHSGHFQQTAALKFIRGLPSAERLQYFARERQLLAKLTHPNIARLLDGGATEAGQPYLVMEYIDGVPIDVYCQQHQLTCAQILNLFVDACDAVAFAHRQLIVHCDLKPSNLLVNKEGRPTLLDFGIARLVDRVNTESADSRDQAQASSSGGYTPKYASPEQRAHGSVSTASDIYSLGILLDELLALSKSNDAELAAILARASAQEPTARYATVEALVEDISRYRRRMPLQAMAATGTYITRKFIQRRWPLVLAASVFLLTVAGFTTKVIIESQRALQAEQVALVDRDRAKLAEHRSLSERDRANAAEIAATEQREMARVAESQALVQRDRAESAQQQAVLDRNMAALSESTASQTRDFLVSVFKSSSPNAQSGDIRASALVAEAETRVEQEMRGQPALQADLYLALADVQKNMGSLKQAKDNYQKAIALERMQNRPLVLSQMLRRLAVLDMSTFGGKDALRLSREALALSQKYDKPYSESLADALRAVAYSTFDAEEAQAMYLRALAILQKLDPDGAKTEATLVLLGHNARDLRRSDAALTYYRRALAIIEKKNGADHPFSMSPVDGIAKSLTDLGNWSQAEPDFQRNIALSERLHGTDNLTTARYVAGYGSFLETVGRPRDALAQNTKALAVFEKRLSREAPQFVLTSVQAAGVMRDLGNFNAAAAMARQARLSAYQAWAAPHPALAIVERGVGRILLDAGEASDGNQSLAAALEMLKQMHGESHFSVAEAAIDLSIGLAMVGNGAAAAQLLDRVGPAVSTLSKDAQMRFALSRGNVARARGRISEALAFYRSAEEFASDRYGANDTRAWLIKLARAEVLAQRNEGGDRAAASTLASAVMANVVAQLEPSAPVIAKLTALASQ